MLHEQVKIMGVSFRIRKKEKNLPRLITTLNEVFLFLFFFFLLFFFFEFIAYLSITQNCNPSKNVAVLSVREKISTRLKKSRSLSFFLVYFALDEKEKKICARKSTGNPSLVERVRRQNN